MSGSQLSVEEHISGCPINDTEILQLLAVNYISIEQNSTSPLNPACIPYDTLDLIDPQHCDIGKNDLDMYLPKANYVKDSTLDIARSLVVTNDLLKQSERTKRRNIPKSVKSNSVSLSESVGVTMPNISSGPIEVLHPLEAEYKPRYKSDYFAQDGKVRMPRYVADQVDNHYVSLKVTSGLQGYIRIDWVTVCGEDGVRYSMPYKFQQNHKINDGTDSNPIYEPIKPDARGTLKLYLVLIKAKQDELKAFPGFSQFPPIDESPATKKFKQIGSLTPKQLIQEYQLDKSQLAFTFCSLSPDGQSCFVDWSTTVYSTVMTETSATTGKKRPISCPQCSHTFEITVEGGDDTGHEKVIKKRK